MDSPKTEQIIQAKQCGITSVTVYTDRAEVVRHIPLTLNLGLNEIKIENVAKTIIDESIRVDGQGKATVREVQFKDQYLKDFEIGANPEIDQLKKDLEELNVRKGNIEDGKEILTKQLEAIGGLVNSFSKSGKSENARKFDENTEKSLEKLYEFHENKAKQLNERIRKSAKELELLESDLNIKKHQLDKLTREARVKKSIVVTLENTGGNDEKVTLQLTYQVRQACWSPSYDIRFNLKPEAGKENDNNSKQLQLTYFGNIKQRTGEEWKDVKLSLSTAQPNVGKLPKLESTQAYFDRPEEKVHRVMATRALRADAPATGGAMLMDDEDEEMGYGLFDADAFTEKFEHEMTMAEEQELSTNFNIPQKKTIPDDDSDHKVTIVILDLAASPLRYDCVPSKNTNVFMSVSVVNSSPFPLLKGSSAIYVDNCFTQRIRMEAVPTGDRFFVPLGVSPSVQVTYKPAHKHHHQTGLISKTSNLIHEQKIQLKNTKKENILVTLVEPFPKSTDEKIKIRLMSPELTQKYHKHANGNTAVRKVSSSTSTVTASLGSSTITAIETDHLPAVGAHLNGDNNIEWCVMLEGGGKEVELRVKWEAEYPANEKLRID